MGRREEEDFQNNTNDIYVDNAHSQSTQYNNQYDFADPSVDYVLSDLRPINEGTIFATGTVRNNEGYGLNGNGNGNGNGIFSPLSFARLKSSFLPRSSSAESASTTNTSHSEISSVIHHRHHQQQSPQRCGSSTASEGILSVDNQNMQSDYFATSMLTSKTRMSSVSLSKSVDAGIITPTELDLGVTPTPIDPYHNHPDIGTRKEREELKDTKSVDELMANELNKLSFQERETIYEEIHGIDVRNAGVRETPELLSKSFEQLELELQKLRSVHPAWDRGQRLFGDTTYLNSEETRIMFLRCDLFDWKKTANRLCDYAELLLDIFGDFALQRRPYITDLNDLELRVLETGGYQVLPGRDRAGRRILGNLAFDAPKEFGFLSRLRVGVYMIMAFLEDVETQRRGVVALSWWHDISVDDFIIRKKVHEKVKCIPMRLGAFHCCIPSENKSARNGKKSKDSDGGLSSGMAQIVKAMFVMSVGSELRPHLRFHTGSVVECIYALQSFGIDADQVPISSSSGKLKTMQHAKWLEFRCMKEESLKMQGHKFDRIIECPNQTDVLFGRGRPIMRHPGNAVLRSIVQLKLEEYANAKSKKETTDVTWEVVRTLKGKYGARFLKEENIANSLGWIEVSNEIARQKVRIAFRDLRTKITKTNAGLTKANSTNKDHDEMGGTSANIVKIKRKGECGSPIPIPPSTKSSTNSSQLRQERDSSTSVFLGMDGSDTKRQRLCF